MGFLQWSRGGPWWWSWPRKGGQIWPSGQTMFLKMVVSSSQAFDCYTYISINRLLENIFIQYNLTLIVPFNPAESKYASVLEFLFNRDFLPHFLYAPVWQA